MAEQVVNHKCLNCDAPLRFDSESGKLACDYCGSKFEIAEIEAVYKEREQRAAEAAQASQSGWEQNFSDDWGTDAGNLRTYSCPSCGAELICDETTAASRCPYCGNQTVIPGQFSGALKPEYIIPFKKDKNAAIAALKDHYKGKKLLPKAFCSENHIEEIQGVYVPFWLYDCEGSGRMKFHAEKVHTRETDKERIEETEHFTVLRDGGMSFEKVPADASKRMPDEHMDSIEPYNYGDLKDFSTAYLPGFLADKYDEDSEVCGARMEKRCREAVESSIRDSVTGYDSTRVVEKQIVIKKGEVHYAMLPVWMLSTRWNEQNYLFAMNGQTGKLTGDLPCDKGKFWSYFAGISGVLIAIMMAFNFLALGLDLATMLIACVLVPLLIGFVTVSVMKSQLKSVRTPTAKQYSKNGLKLRVKEDKFLNKTYKRTPKTDAGRK